MMQPKKIACFPKPLVNPRRCPPTWGLITKNELPIPLKSLNISVKILHNVARVSYTQVYFNNFGSLLETEFFFPISPDACFDSFEARFANTTIKGVIKEKQQAKEEYKQAVEKGNTVAYSEINEETNDIMKILIGNIPSNSLITITYSYIQKLETSLNRFWCFRLFSTLTPRYNGNLHDYLKQDVSVLSHYPTVNTNNNNAYPWSVEVEIQSPSPISMLKSPSHPIVTTYGNENHTCTISLDPSVQHHPNKDFVLLYNNGKEDALDSVMTPFEDGYCAMLTYMADFDKTPAGDAYNNFEKAKESVKSHSMDSIRGEYIFLLDRSGSMKGDRITMAKNSLLLFLKSLPTDSLFNVVSFGGYHQLMHHTSVAYSQQSVNTAVQQVQYFEANMGSTEIYAALRAIFDLPMRNGYPRYVFLLTDGAVSNTSQVLDLINRNNTRARVFTIGVGNGCSAELVTKSASFGKGKHEFVADNSEIYEKVINLLDASLSPCYSDLSLSADNFDALVESVSPNPAEVPFLLNGEPLTFFLFLRKDAFHDGKTMTITLKMYDSRLKTHRNVEITLDANDALQNELLPKLAIHDMMKRLEAQQVNQKTVLWMDKREINSTLISMSLKYGVLCKKTAFLCEIAENKDTASASYQPKMKVTVPTILSQDYPQGQSHPQPHVPQFKKSGGAVLRGSAMKTEKACSTLSLQSAQSNRPTTAAPAYSGSAMYSASAMDSKKKMNCAVAKPVSKAVSNRAECASMEFEECKRQREKCDMRPSSSISTSTTSKPTTYLDIIMKQSFEGSWDASDNNLLLTILKNTHTIPALPDQLKELSMNAWVTLLVLVWLEVVCENERKAWRFVHQKGCEWLKNQGLNYEEAKTLAQPIIQG